MVEVQCYQYFLAKLITKQIREKVEEQSLGYMEINYKSKSYKFKKVKLCFYRIGKIQGNKIQDSLSNKMRIRK